MYLIWLKKFYDQFSFLELINISILLQFSFISLLDKFEKLATSWYLNMFPN